MYSHNSTSIRVSAFDTKEGFFYFDGGTAVDRAGNVSNTITSADFANRIWIDPVAPMVSGLISTSPTNFTGSGFDAIDPSIGSGSVSQS